MKPIHRFSPILAATAVALCAAAAAPAARAVPIPSTLSPAAHESPRLHVGARGVQVYQCRARPGGHAWTLVAPEADLFDSDGRLVGSHGAGPSWRFVDGRRVTARLKARADAPRPDDIPWLLLETRTQWPGEGRTGTHGRLTSIQRIHTRGGAAPDAGCDTATAGSTVRVPYTAEYVLYGH